MQPSPPYVVNRVVGWPHHLELLDLQRTADVLDSLLHDLHVALHGLCVGMELHSSKPVPILTQQRMEGDHPGLVFFDESGDSRIETFKVLPLSILDPPEGQGDESCRR